MTTDSSALASYVFVCGLAAVAGCIVVHGWLRPGYGAVRQYVCELLLGDGALAQKINFVLLGVLQLWFAVLLLENGGGGPAARFGSLLVMLSGVGVIGCAVFPTERKPLSMMSLSERTHMILALAACALIAAAMQMCASDSGFASRWPWLTAWSTRSAIGMFLALAVGGLLPMTRDPVFVRVVERLLQAIDRTTAWRLTVPLLRAHGVISQAAARRAGLIERAGLANVFVWEAVVAIALSSDAVGRWS